MTQLSNDALCVATAYFRLGTVGTACLIFNNRVSKPTTRTQLALDELVDAGVLTVKRYNRFGGKKYTYAKAIKFVSNAFIDEHGDFKLVERIKNTKEPMLATIKWGKAA